MGYGSLVRFGFLLAVLMLTTLVGGCAPRPRDRSRLRVVTTVGMVTDIVQRVAGDDADVIGLFGPGVDPHLYKASFRDVVQLDEADIVFYSGLHLEGKMTDMFEKMSRTKAVIAVAEAIPESLRHKQHDAAGAYDPHVWMDPARWKYILDPIVATLSEARPDHAAVFAARADSLRAGFDSLTAWAKRDIESIPKPRRVLITAHDAFGYFGEAFAIEVQGLQGMSTATDFGLADVTHLVDLMASRGVKAVFVESSVPRKPLEAVVAGCRARGHTVVIGGELFSDAMGAPGTEDGTYFGMIRHNVNTIVGALR
ncbi:MAG: zinc ABC transporter substrate-binding protein [bacterium]|nr:zinc ABC transporter substrate-binding protein [bacterium]